MEKKRKNRLFYLLLLLFITSISLSVSSYAWFTSNRLVKVDLLNVSVKAQGGIEISVDGSNWKSSVSADDITNARSNYPSSVNQIPSVLEPVFSVMDIENGKVKLFYGGAFEGKFKETCHLKCTWGKSCLSYKKCNCEFNPKFSNVGYYVMED